MGGRAVTRFLPAAILLVLLILSSSATAHLVNDRHLPRGDQRVREEKARHIAHVIHRVFKRDCRAHEAQKVVSWETDFRVRVCNGQYCGAFQMGSSERATYGHGSTIKPQSRAARRYFHASGRDWSPWTYRPGVC